MLPLGESNPSRPDEPDDLAVTPIPIAVTGQHVGMLASALEGAFTLDELRQLLRIGFDDGPGLALDSIVTVHGRNMHDICGDLTLWALHNERIGLQGLLKLAIQERSYNENLGNLQVEWVNVTFIATACPYPGMQPYTAEWGRFYGRSAEIERAVDYLRRHPFLALIGPSGSGKSSLLYAGIIPALEQSHHFVGRRCIVRSMRPGVTPYSSLCSLLGVGESEDFIAPLTSVLADNAFVLIVVDQNEELYTVADDEQRKLFESTLKRLRAEAGVYIVLCARADFYASLMVAGRCWRRARRTTFCAGDPGYVVVPCRQPKDWARCLHQSCRRQKWSLGPASSSRRTCRLRVSHRPEK